MQYNITLSKQFTEQVSELDSKSKRIIEDKIRLIAENPYHFKKIYSKRFSKVFRVRLNIQNQETRLIYVVLDPDIILVCLLDRRKDYKDLDKFLENI